jgi:putative transposase
MQGRLSIERMCVLAMVSRVGFYRSLQQRDPDVEEMELRSAIQAIAVEHRLRYGYRRVAAELRHRGFLANHKRVDSSPYFSLFQIFAKGEACPVDGIFSRVFR